MNLIEFWGQGSKVKVMVSVTSQYNTILAITWKSMQWLWQRSTHVYYIQKVKGQYNSETYSG